MYSSVLFWYGSRTFLSLKHTQAVAKRAKRRLKNELKLNKTKEINMFVIQFPFTMFYFKPLLVLVVVNLTFGSTNCSSLLTYMQLWVICTSLAIFSVSQVFKGDVSQNEEPNGRSDAWQHDQPEGMFVFEKLPGKLME